MLHEQIKIVEDGGDPINVFRDPAQNAALELPNEEKGIALGMKTIRNLNINIGGNRGPLYEWQNPESWAGQGLRNWLAERDIPMGDWKMRDHYKKSQAPGT